MSETAWITRGGAKYHLVPDCGALRDGQQAARDKGRSNHPVTATTVEQAMADGRDPCLRCSPPIADTLTGQWGQFIRGLRGFQPEPTIFEREFAARVLSEVTGLRPDQVHPQYEITDGTGRSRYIDFAIIDRAVRIAIEIDGGEKIADQSPQTQHEALLTRQNELVNQGWQVLRFTNSQVIHRSAQCARTVTDALAAPKSPRTATEVERPADSGVADKGTTAPARLPMRSEQPSRPRWLAPVAVAVAVAAVVVASLLLIRPHAQPGPISEITQQQHDLANGAAAPIHEGRDCPTAEPIKANYRSDRNTRYYFTAADPYYDRTTPTSCWTSTAAARAGGYRAP
jgi:hypothetical protein